MSSELPTIVIVESQPLMRTALSTALSTDGMTVLAEVAKNGDALQIASKLMPDLILFSMEYLSVNDLERISALHQRLPTVWIVALITEEFFGEFQAVLNHGAHLVLTKNAQRSELLSAIKAMLRNKVYPANAHVN